MTSRELAEKIIGRYAELFDLMVIDMAFTSETAIDDTEKMIREERERVVEECKATVFVWDHEHEHKDCPPRDWGKLGKQLDAIKEAK